MRIAYIDEAGTSDREPMTVVTAVVVDGDRQSHLIVDGLAKIAEFYGVDYKNQDFAFHAKDLWHGNGYFPRKEYGLQTRMEILRTLLHIPVDNDMVISIGWIQKDEMTGQFRPGEPRERNTLYHVMAYIGAVVGVERVMHELYPDEVCHIVAEDHPQARLSLREMHLHLKSDNIVRECPPDVTKFLPLKRIIDAPSFVSKQESAALQIADSCAFVIRGFLEGKMHMNEYYDIIKPAMVSVPILVRKVAE